MLMKIVLQDGVKDCGICSLLSVIRYYGGDVSREYLRELSGTNRNGVTALGLIMAAEEVGFKAEGMKGDLSKIKDNNLPCLAHVIMNKSYKHFVVIYSINLENGKVVIMDPAKGKRILSLAEFKLIESGNYIFLHPVKRLAVMKSKNIIRKATKDLFIRKKALIIMSVFLTAIYFLLQILTAFHFKYLLELGIEYSLTKQILIISIYLAVLYLFRESAFTLRNLLLNKWTFQIDVNLTNKIYRQILLLPYLYYRNRTTGEVISRIKDLNVIKSFLSQVFSSGIIDLISVGVFSYLMFESNKNLTIVVFLFLIILIMEQALFNGFRKKKMKSLNRNNDMVSAYLIESFTNIETIKGSHLEKKIIDNFKIKYEKLLEKSYVYLRIEEIFNLFRSTFSHFLNTIILGYGSYLVILNKFNLAGLIIYQSLFGYFYNSILSLLSISYNFQNYKLAKERIEDLFMISSEKFSGSYYYLLNKFEGKIEFRNLDYQTIDKVLFDKVSFLIKPGEKVLLVGDSGSGKSTLMKILMRYFEVPFGFVKISDIDINHIHLDVIRRNITYVSNLDTLFRDSLYNNIVLNREISEEEFQKIVQITRVNELVDEETQYQRLVEDNGSNFSNGERQRIILARSLVRDSTIYIFDEAFSQIDSYKTSKILKDIFAYLEDKTIIVISHRFNQQKLFDKILKLEKGRVCEVSKL